MSTDTETTPDLTEYENWTAEDCYHADRQIELLQDRVGKLQAALDKLAGEKREHNRR
jgi:hypothetical protein